MGRQTQKNAARKGLIMQAVYDQFSGVEKAVSDVLRAAVAGISGVIDSINIEIAEYARISADVITVGIVDIIDNTIGFFNTEWPVIQSGILEISRRIAALAAQQAAKVKTSLDQLEAILDIIIDSFEQSVSAIEEIVDEAFQKREFAIYGAIAEFSSALGVSTDFLENVIQNARFFSMSVAVRTGLGYYDFLDNWQKGLDNLLFYISKNVSLFKAEPQYIKVVIEQTLIKPIFDIENDRSRKEQAVIEGLVNRLVELKEYTVKIPLVIEDLNIKVDNLYENEIRPALFQLSENFSAWQKDVYNPDRQTTTVFITNMYKAMSLASSRIGDLINSLNYGGDILMRINNLSTALRIEQEIKIADVSTRRFREVAPDWTEVIEKRKT